MTTIIKIKAPILCFTLFVPQIILLYYRNPLCWYNVLKVNLVGPVSIKAEMSLVPE